MKEDILTQVLNLLTGFTVPAWFFDTAIAAFGALIAFATWSWLHSPHLAVSETSNKKILETDNGEIQNSNRIQIENYGTKSAHNCETTLTFSAKTDNSVIYSYVRSPWIPKKAELIVDDNEQTYQTTIPAGQSQKIEVFRKYRNGTLKVDTKSSGRRFVIIGENSEYHPSDYEKPEIAFLKSPRTRKESDIETKGTLDDEIVSEIDWSSAFAKLTVETESARPLEISLDMDLTDEGRIKINEAKTGRMRILLTYPYKLQNRLRILQ